MLPILKKFHVELPCLYEGWGESVENTYMVKVIFTEVEEFRSLFPKYNTISEKVWRR